MNQFCLNLVYNRKLGTHDSNEIYFFKFKMADGRHIEKLFWVIVTQQQFSDFSEILRSAAE